jgi:hypothetical protein
MFADRSDELVHGMAASLQAFAYYYCAVISADIAKVERTNAHYVPPLRRIESGQRRQDEVNDPSAAGRRRQYAHDSPDQVELKTAPLNVPSYLMMC